MVVATVLGGAIVLIGAAIRQEEGPGVIRAERLRIVGREGQSLIDLGATADGNPEMVLFDANRKRRVVISSDKVNGPTVLLTDGEGRAKLIVNVHPRLGSAISWLDNNAGTRLLLGYGANGPAALGFQNPEGMTQLEVSVDETGAPRLILRDKERQVLFQAP
jgi:hypothetical protein